MSSTGNKNDPEKPLPPITFTPEQKAAALRKLRRARYVLFGLTALIVCFGAWIVYRQTQSPLSAGLTALAAIAYLVFRAIRARRRDLP